MSFSSFAIKLVELLMKNSHECIHWEFHLESKIYCQKAKHGRRESTSPNQKLHTHSIQVTSCQHLCTASLVLLSAASDLQSSLLVAPFLHLRCSRLLDEDRELWFRAVALAHKPPKSGDNRRWTLNWSRACQGFVRGRGKSAGEGNRWRVVVHYVSCMVSLGGRARTSETLCASP